MNPQDGLIASVSNLNNIQIGSQASAGGFINPDLIVGSFGLQEGMKIADFGSGSGYFTILMGKIAGEGGLITALDIMENSLETVRSKAKSEGLRNIQTVRSNLEVLGSSGLSNDSQDFVLMANILFQSDKKDEILREASRVLKEGGTLMIIDWKKGAGGFGPPDNLRLDPLAMQSITVSNGFEFADFIDAGAFHYGLKFVKKYNG